MTKSELLNALAEKSGLQKTQIDKTLSALVAVIHEQVSAGSEIAIPELGKFVRADRAARTGRNPQTGETMELPAKKVPAFKAAKAFKDIVNK